MANLNSNPLFLIFTFFNNQLKFDSTNDEFDLNYKWENRFIKVFKEGIVSLIMTGTLIGQANNKHSKTFIWLETLNIQMIHLKGLTAMELRSY